MDGEVSGYVVGWGGFGQMVGGAVVLGWWGVGMGRVEGWLGRGGGL